MNSAVFCGSIQGKATYVVLREILSTQTKNEPNAPVHLTLQLQVCALIWSRQICFEHNSPDS